MTEENQQEKPKEPEPIEIPDKEIYYDWRNPLKPRNPEDDLIVDGWRRCADGTFEKIIKPETGE